MIADVILEGSVARVKGATALPITITYREENKIVKTAISGYVEVRKEYDSVDPRVFIKVDAEQLLHTLEHLIKTTI